MTDFTKQRLVCSHGPDIVFNGRIMHEYSTQNKAGTKDRWTELRLWETEGGAWIAENVGMSSREREGDIREAVVIGDDVEENDARRRVMECFEWTTAAKAFARGIGWDMTLKVD